MSQTEPEDELLNLADLPLTTQNPAYSAAEMVACPKCSRANAPNRFNCIYCGGELGLEGGLIDHARLTLRPAEDWEQGYSVVLLKAENADINGAASILNLNAELVGEIVASDRPLPVARLSSLGEANAIGERLADRGVAARIISDETFDAGHLPKRLRGIRFLDDGVLQLILFSDGRSIDVRAEDVALIVSGTIRKSELATSSKRKKGTFRAVEETATSSDTSVIDIFSRGDARGFRIISMGFDFSGLGSGMSQLATANIKILTEKLRTACPQARFDDRYDEIRWLLDAAWPVESNRQSGGVQRGPVGGIEAKSVETSDNTKQLTRYSRLCFHLL
jgi:hypothetical protein